MQILNNRYALVPNEAPRMGGMAEIRRAIDMLEGQRPVAIKLFSAGLEADRLHLEAYSRECQILQRLEHPNIVRILDGGSDPDSGRRFLVLEWLERSLSEHVASTPLAGWDTFFEDIGQPILGALSYAFGKGVVHRDIKPQNVLFSPEGQLKVADFGISKLRTLVAPGLTVAGFRSVPYAPPENDDGRYTDTRDVYGFAVLTLACLGRVPLTNYEDVYRSLEEFDGPPDVASILEQALSRDPHARHPNIVALRKELELAQGRREDHFAAAAEQRRCYVKIARIVEERLRTTLGHPAPDLRHAVIADLNEICGIRRYERSGAKNDGSIQFSLYAGQYMYHASVDRETRAYLLVHGVSAWQPSWLEFQRESAWVPVIKFALLVGPPPADAPGTMAWIVDSVAEQETRFAEHRRVAQADALFRTWSSILQAKSEIEQRRVSSIPFDGIERRGSRLKMYTTSVPSEDLVGQPRLIELSEHRVIVGEIEAVGSDHIVLWTEEEVPDEIPRRGKLQFDTRAERQALLRQRQALDAVRFRRSARQDLRELLVEPEKAQPPGDPGDVHFVADRLDESKQQAVRKALGTDSFLVVEGPPGTGKTRFITELVLQTLRRNPRSRILLTSQTHVALDHALEQLRTLNPALKLVRIGRRHDERISRDVLDLLLENRVDTWLKAVQTRSEKYLKAHASDLGVDTTEIALGMAAERLRLAQESLDTLEGRWAETESALSSLAQEEAQREATGKGDTYHEVKEALRETSETARHLEFEIKRARDRVKEGREVLAALPDLGVELSKQSGQELREWEQAFLDRDDRTRRMHRLVTLTQEWYLRFGRSRDFFAALIADSQVIAGTCLGFAGVRGMNAVDFDLCIVDEASKAAVNELLVPLSRSRRWVLVGDRNQLPPFVEDALDDPALLEVHNLKPEDLQTTLLEMLADRLPAGCVTRLLHQHRMVRQIGDLVSSCFYDGQLKSLREGDSGYLAPALPRPVTWFSTSLLRARWEMRDHASFKNIAEVVNVCRILKQINFLARIKRKRFSVAVLTAYASQKEELRRALDADHLDLESVTIECNTVDAFQGREADIAIYSVTRCNDRGDIGFLRERRRLNVALSRARFGLAIVGDSAFVRSAKGVNPWSKVLDHIESHPGDCAMQEVAE